VTIGSSSPTGISTLTVSATGGGITKTRNVTLIITP
jgi:hypothetical protein